MRRGMSEIWWDILSAALLLNKQHPSERTVGSSPGQEPQSCFKTLSSAGDICCHWPVSLADKRQKLERRLSQVASRQVIFQSAFIARGFADALVWLCDTVDRGGGLQLQLPDEWAKLPAVRMVLTPNGSKDFLLLTQTHQVHLFHETSDHSMPIEMSLPWTLHWIMVPTLIGPQSREDVTYRASHALRVGMRAFPRWGKWCLARCSDLPKATSQFVA